METMGYWRAQSAQIVGHFVGGELALVGLLEDVACRCP